MAVGYNPNQYTVGMLKFSATLLANTPIDDGAGGQQDNYTPVLTTRCFLLKLSGGFSFQSGSFFMDKRYKMICRYQLAISAVTIDHIWQIKGNTYRIIDHTKIDDTPHFYEFILQKQ